MFMVAPGSVLDACAPRVAWSSLGGDERSFVGWLIEQLVYHHSA